jgi:(4-O-methyl)-D-glucuronate---lignin esterase
LINNDSAENVADSFTFASAGAPSLWDPETGKVQEAPVFRHQPERTTIPLNLQPYSAVAVVFDNQKVAEDKPHLTRSDGEVLESEGKGKSLKIEVIAEARGSLTVSAVYRGRLVTHSLKETDSLKPVPVEGPWLRRLEGVEKAAVSRPPGSWADEWPGFSGTGWYDKQVVVEERWLAASRKVYLDLGVVKNIAEVRVNGQRAGTRLWSPYRVEITPLLKPGSNRIQIGVTNTLANRYGQGQQNLPGKPASGLIGPIRLVPAKVLVDQFTWK